MKKISLLALTLFCSLLFSNCGNDSRGYSYLYNVLFPFNEANYWIYRDTVFSAQGFPIALRFDTLKYDRVENVNGHTYNVFNKNYYTHNEALYTFGGTYMENTADGTYIYEKSSPGLSLKLFLKYPVKKNETTIFGNYSVTTDTNISIVPIIIDSLNHVNNYRCYKYICSYQSSLGSVKSAKYFIADWGLVATYDSLSTGLLDGSYYLYSKSELINHRLLFPMPD